MRTIAIMNQKGGVAKTTTAVNLAIGLANAGKKTLLIDMDPQANATFAVLGQDEPPLTTYDLLVNQTCSVQDVRVPTSHALLDMIGSDIDLAGAEVELISAIGGQMRLRNKLLENPPAYDYLIIDTPPSLGLLTINALAVVNEVFIPVSASVFALKGIEKLEQTIEQVRTNLGRPELHISGVLCTLYEHTNISNDVVGLIRERFGECLIRSSRKTSSWRRLTAVRRASMRMGRRVRGRVTTRALWRRC
jgi:chromosome partitioning protein